MKRWIFTLTVLVFLLGGCAEKIPVPTLEITAQATLSPVPTPSPTPEPAPELPWWRTAIFYEVFVRSFYDSDGDGIGDFNGLTEKLDYLNDGNPETRHDLGINAIWLMPIHPSPSYHGYDVLNYYAVNPDYGSMEDFKNFLDQAHRRGIRVIIDLVLNHTSDQHPFFADAKRNETSAYHDWYLWSADPHGSGWYPIDIDGKTLSYYGYFCGCMPDLNYKNLDVTQQMDRVAKYWLNEVGVDGFRIDAAKHLIENGDASKVNTPETLAWFADFYQTYKSTNPETYAIGEVANSDARMTALWDEGRLDQIFNFEMASGFVNSVNGESVSGIKGAITFATEDNPEWNFGTFLTNHDQNRVMNVLGGNLAKAKNAAFMLLSHPGTPFIYYGEEIGMTGQKPDEDIRRPMQWSSEPNAEFTTGIPWEEIHSDAKTRNVKVEQDDSDSLLSTYRDLITLRNSHPGLSSGTYTALDAGSRAVYSFIRQAPGELLLVVVNLSKNPVTDYRISGVVGSNLDANYTLTPIFGEAAAEDLVIKDGKLTDYAPAASLMPYQGYIFQLTIK